MLPFAPGITGYYIEKDDVLDLELRSLRSLRTKTFTTQNKTVINTIKQGFSPILEDYLGDSLPGFNDAFLGMQSYPIPDAGEEREFEIFTDTKMKFCWVPAGEAQLGRTKKEQDYVTKTFFRQRFPEWMVSQAETYRGKHKTDGFWMGKYPIIQSQWKAVMSNNPSHFNGDNLPVEMVNWYDCQDFIKKCRVLELKLQLPHEDQWEYACRGGRGNKQAFYWGDTLNGDKANCDGTVSYGTDEKGVSLAKTTEVGSYEKVAPHPWGLCDMHGNVYEWCENLCDNENLYIAIRSGSWTNPSWSCGSAFRFIHQSHGCMSTIGFRLIIC